MTNFTNGQVGGTVETIGEVLHPHSVLGGVVVTIFLSGDKRIVPVLVQEMDLAEVGIDVRPGVQFAAHVSAGAVTPEEFHPTGFAAIDQLDNMA